MTRPTLVSLAHELGVSRQTVSNVINAPHLVRESTRLRVQAAIDAAGYRPSAAARALRTQKSGAIALRLHAIGDGINGAVMDRFLHCVVEQAEQRGHRVVVFTATDNAAEIDDLRDLVDRHAIDGTILTATSDDDERVAALTDMQVPFAAFGRPWGDEDPEHLWADVDGAAGTHEATELLYEQGFQRVGFIGWPEHSSSGNDRLRGWLEVAAGRHADADQLVVHTEDGIGEGVEAMRVLHGRGCDAAVCASDSLAVGALDVLRRGLSTPVFPAVGFDDTPVARAIGLSSVTQPVEAAATILVHKLIAQIEDRAPEQSELPSHTPVGDAGHLLTPSVALRAHLSSPLP